MGVEFFLLLLIAVLAVGAFFFSGSFGVAKAAINAESDGERRVHAYVENPAEGEILRR